MEIIASRAYNPNPQQCCEACVFGNGAHAEFCEKQKIEVESAWEIAADGFWRHGAD
jgi:hypothetical protein